MEDAIETVAVTRAILNWNSLVGRKTEIAKGIAIAGVALILFPAQVLCALPTAVSEDLSHLQVL